MNTLNLSKRIGFYAALFSTIFGFLYLLGLVANLATTGSPYPASDSVQMISATIALLWNQTLLMLFVVLRERVSEDRKILGELMLAFAIMVCATSSISWFVRLTSVPLAQQAGNATLLALLDLYDPGSITFAIEHVSWGVFFGLATLFAGFALQSNGSGIWTRWLLALSGLLSLLHALGLVISSPILVALGYVAWALPLPVATLLLTIQFRRK
jgi:hypothetical protein